MTKLAELIKAYQDLISRNKYTREKLKAKIEEIEAFKVKCATAKTVGTISSIVGGVGLLLIPFTGGVSALVTGVIGTVGGLATNTITDLINSNETKAFIKELESYNEARKKDIETLTGLLEELSKYVQLFKEKGLNDGDALTYGFLKMAGIQEPRSVHSFSQRRKLASTLFDIGTAAGAIYICNLLMTESLAIGIGMKGISVFGSVIRGFASTTTKVAGTLARSVFAGATVAFIAIDIKKLVNEWSDGHPAANYGLSINSQIDEELKCYNDMLRQLIRFQESLTELEKDDKKKCTCADVELSIFYVNIQSMRPSCNNSAKHLAFCRHIREKTPDIVIIVETWLTPDISTQVFQNVWNLQDYDLGGRYDRTDGRRGGGILVGWKRRHLARMDFDFSSDLDLANSDRLYYLNKDFMRFFCFSKYFNCARCKKVGLFQGGGLKTYTLAVFYRRPGAYKESNKLPAEDSKEFREENEECIGYLLDFFQGRGGFGRFERSAGIIVGDFNWTDKDWDNYVGNASRLFRVPIESPTYRGITNPDGIISVPIGFVNPSVIPTFDCGTSHKSLFFKLKLGKDYPEEEPCELCMWS